MLYPKQLVELLPVSQSSVRVPVVSVLDFPIASMPVIISAFNVVMVRLTRAQLSFQFDEPLLNGALSGLSQLTRRQDKSSSSTRNGISHKK